VQTSAKRRFGLLVVAVAALLALSACSYVMGSVEFEDGGLSASQERYLVKIGMIDKGEDVRFFTSGGLDFEESGHLFTDVRVGAYWLPDHTDKEDRVEWILLKDVQAIELTETDAWTYSDYVTVTPGKGDPLKVYLPGSDGFPKRFHEALTRQWEKVKAQK